MRWTQVTGRGPNSKALWDFLWGSPSYILTLCGSVTAWLCWALSAFYYPLGKGICPWSLDNTPQMHPRKWMASFWNCILQLQLKVCFFEGEMRLTEWTQFNQRCHLFWGLSTVDSRNTYIFPMIAFSIYISFFQISLNFFIYLNSKCRDEQISVLTRRQTRITEHLGSWWQKCKGNLASRFWSAIISFSSSHSSQMRQWTGMGKGVLCGLKKLLSLLTPIWNSLIYNSFHFTLGLLETSSKKQNKIWVLQLKLEDGSTYLEVANRWVQRTEWFLNQQTLCACMMQTKKLRLGSASDTGKKLPNKSQDRTNLRPLFSKIEKRS